MEFQLMAVKVDLGESRSALTASAHLASHEWHQAIRLLRAELRSQGPVREMEHLARTFHDLGAAYLGLGNPETAFVYCKKAMAAQTMTRQAEHTPALQNNLALALLRSGRLAEAEPLIENTLGRCAQPGREADRARLLLSKTELLLVRGDHQRARPLVCEAIAISERQGDRLTLAEAHEWLAAIDDAAGSHESADRAFETALCLLSSLNMRPREAECHARFGHLLERRGDLARSLFHFKRAVRLSTTLAPTASSGR
jgi:tetratricopeptide (TPR) repeat protein